MSNNQPIEDVKPTYKPEDFAKAYQELCDKMGFRIVVSPNYVGRDDGTFSTVLNYTVGQLPKVEQKI